jgi:von Willebrand factor A domain-containing protein 5
LTEAVQWTERVLFTHALLLFLRSLPVSSYFNIVGFGSHFQALFESSQLYTDETVDLASRYASSIDAEYGGTEILAPLAFIFDQPSQTGIERQIFILTDGQV